MLSVAITHDGLTVASGGEDGRLLLFDIETGTVKRAIEVCACVWSPSPRCTLKARAKKFGITFHCA